MAEVAAAREVEVVMEEAGAEAKEEVVVAKVV
jgi:hypothetical protein